MYYCGELMEECFANTTLSGGNLHGLLFISWHILSNGNELIPDIVKLIANENSTYYAIFHY